MRRKLRDTVSWYSTRFVFFVIDHLPDDMLNSVEHYISAEKSYRKAIRSSKGPVK
jgi:hypothetical protein